jgi:hypothetical protein
MKNLIYLLLLFPVLAFCQSNSTKNTPTNTNLIVKSTITTTFSKPTVLAYQEKAVAIINDFYAYINFYKTTENNQLLEKEIDNSIESLFLNENIIVKDVFLTNLNPITLKQFLKKCKLNKATILVSTFNQNNTTSDTYFTFTYNLQVTFNNKTTSQTITQKVYFFPSLKSFGDQQKNVWQLKLGEF